jgi:hypothetical protein
MIHDTGASVNNEPSKDTEPDRDPETTDSHSITDAEVIEALQKGIREAAGDNVREELINEGESSLYYDSLTMSPLNAMSAVSLLSYYSSSTSCFYLAFCSRPNASAIRFSSCVPQIANKHHISQGRYCPLPRLQASLIPAMGPSSGSETGCCLDTAVC